MQKERGVRTLAHEFLDLEKEVFEVPEKCYKILESILRQAKKDLKDTKEVPGDVYLYTIAKLLKDTGFSYKTNDLLHKGLQTKQIDCKHYSIIYYSIAEQLALPLSIVKAPLHVFVRWNGENTFNWEATSGKEHDDQHYIDWLKIHEKPILNGVYLKNKTREQAKAIIFSTRGNARDKKNDSKGALEDYIKAIELDPNSVESYNNRGIVKKSLGNLDEAILDYTRTIDLDPNFFKAYHNRGIAKTKKRNFEEAISDFDKAIELEPEDKAIYKNRGIAKELKGDYKGAIADYRKALELFEKKEDENTSA